MRRARWARRSKDADLGGHLGARDALYLCYLAAALGFVWWRALRGPEERPPELAR